ncbi:hypothetical protein [Actinomadura rudentiformis]|uniref:Uncharacterized protein n=1 Tax=Actinomadura rudentiformis TaxID=359158 RepID=A0A6H9YIG0_9ACTN|nr:hypothetical protein [Actinomadura rudentiformis]KAB2346434.1 hypothetical protein F8566_23495 [Actinomadura rudentiformis]
MKTRIALYAVGGSLILLGLRGIVTESEPRSWVVWFAGAVLLHDFVLVPAVLVIGVLTAWLPVACRTPVRAALIVAGALTLVASPMVLSTGQRPDNPSILPLSYGRSLVILLALVVAVTAIWLLRKRTQK